MKICYVVHQFLPQYFTGTEQYAYAVAQETRRRGHEVRVFTLDPSFGDEARPWVEERDEVDGLPVTRVRYWNLLHRDVNRLEHRHPLLAHRFGQSLDEDPPNLIHIFHLRFLGTDLIDAARARGIATVVHLMDFWFLCPRVILTRGDGSLCDGPPDEGAGCIPCAEPELAAAIERADATAPLAALREAAPPAAPPGRTLAHRAAAFTQRPALMRHALARADAVVAPSRFLRDVFAHNGHDAEHIDVCSYGVDRARLAGAERTRSAAELAEHGPVFGFVGSLARHKGLHVAIEAFRRTRGDARLEVWGRVEDFAEYAGALRDACSDAPRVRFRGPFEQPELGRVLAGLDALVVPSMWYENTPFVVLEAMAAGRPVLASDLGGIAEIVRDEVWGDLFPRGCVDSLHARLQRLIDDPDRLRRYREAMPEIPDLRESVDRIETIYANARQRADAAGRQHLRTP